MPFLRNPQTGEIVIADDPTGALQQGFQVATDDEVDAFARQLDYGTTGQQAQAQGERVVRGATFGAVEGFGEPEDIRARAEVSEQLSPVTSFGATILPDLAVGALTGGLSGLATGSGRAAAGAALRGGAGLARAGLAAGRAGGAAALAGESIGTGLVTAGQNAYAEERSAVDDPGKFAEDVLFWGGLNFGLGRLMGAGRAANGVSRETAEAGVDELDDIAKAAEFEAAGKIPAEATPGTPGQIYNVEGAPAPAAPAAGGSVDDLSRQFNELTGLSLKQAAGGAALGAAGVLAADDEEGGALAASAGGLALLGGRRLKPRAVQRAVDDLARRTDAAVKSLTKEEREAIAGWSTSSHHTKQSFEAVTRTPEENAIRMREMGYSEAEIERTNFRRGERFASESDEETVAIMNGAFDKLAIDNPTDRAPLFRAFSAGDSGYDMPDIQSLLTKDTFVNKTPISTSLNPHVVPDFFSKSFVDEDLTPVILEFDRVNRAVPRVHPDIQTLSESARRREAEVIIPPGSTFRVIDRKPQMVRRRGAMPSETGPQAEREAVIIRLEQIEDAPREAWKDAAMIGAILGAGAADDDESGALGASAIGLGALVGKRGLLGKAGKKVARGAVDAEPTIGLARPSFETLPVGKRSIPSGGDVPRDLPPIPADDVFHAENIPQTGILSERLSGPIGKTPGGFFRGDDGIIRYVKVDKNPAHSTREIANTRMYQALGVRTPELQAVELPGGKRGVTSEFLGSQWRELDSVDDWAALPQSVRDGYAAQVPIDILLGNWDVSRNARNVMTDGTSTLMVDAGEAGVNAWGSKWFSGNYPHTSTEIQRTAQAGKGQVPSSLDSAVVNPAWGPFVGQQPPHALLAGYAQTPGQLRAIVEQSYTAAKAKVEAAGGPAGFIRQHMPELSAPELERAASEMGQRIRALDVAVPTLAALIYAQTTGTEADTSDPAAAAGIEALGLLLGGRFKRAFSAGGKAAARRAATDAAEDGMARALRNASKTNADDIVDRAVRGVAAEGDSLGRQRRLYMNRAPILEVATREMQQDLTKVAKDVEQVTRADKLASVAAHVSDNLSAQKSAARVISEDAAKFAGELRGEARAYAAESGKDGLQYAVPSQQKFTLALMDHARAIDEATTGKGLFEALDGFKRATQDFKMSFEKGAAGPESIHYQQLIPRVEAFARQIRSTLEQSTTWGQAGDMQRAYNAVISDKLMPSMRVFEEAVLKKTHRGYDGIWNTEGWETKISGLLKNRDPGARRHVSQVLDGMDELASVRRQYGDAKTATRIEEGTSKIRRTIGLADEVDDATERMEALGELVGAVPIVGGMTRGFVTGDVFAAYQRLSGASDAALGRGVDDWIRSSRQRGSGVRMPKIVQSAEAKQLSGLAARQGISQTLALFQGDDDSPGSAFERWRDALLDDESFFQELGTDFDTLQRSDSDSFLMLAGRANLARQFLIQRMPPNVAVSMANPNGYPPSRESVEDWADYVVAVRHPQTIVENVGAMTQPQVETLRTVYPRRHEQLQQRVIEAIGAANDAGEPLDDSFLIRAALLFPDVDGLGSPVFSREFGAAVRERNMAQQQEQRQRSGAPRKAPSNPLSATIAGGATFGSGF